MKKKGYRSAWGDRYISTTPEHTLSLHRDSAFFPFHPHWSLRMRYLSDHGAAQRCPVRKWETWSLALPSRFSWRQTWMVAIALGEMEVPDAEFSAGDVHGVGRPYCHGLGSWCCSSHHVLGGLGVFLLFLFLSWFWSHRIWEFRSSGSKATMRSRLLAWINSPSCRFHSARISADGPHSRMLGWGQACEAHTRDMSEK